MDPLAIGGEQHIRLACQACQRKKIKCDRTFPCGQCQRSSLQCNASSRKPRARHAGKRAVDSELRSRITKLESLVESLSGEVGVPDHYPCAEGTEDTHSSGSNEATSPGIDIATAGKYIANPFWSSLTTEVAALRDALEDDQEDGEDSLSPATSSPYGSSQGVPPQDFDLIICPPGSVFVLPNALNEPTPEMQAILYRMFFDNFAPILRCFHIPTLQAFVERGAPYLGVDANAPANRLLKSVLWFASIHTISDAECEAKFDQARPELASQLRRCVDVWLSQVDIMCTTDIATLQALSTFLISSRRDDNSRRVWTMTSLAVRIARAMNLHIELPGKSPFETELRRRLWHQIRFLDIFTAVDRGAEVLIAAGSFDTPLPTNINDSDFDESSAEIIANTSGLTDMSFCLLVYDATSYTETLTTPENAPRGDKTWKKRLEIAQTFNSHVQNRYLLHCNMTSPFHRLISAVGKSMCTGMILRAVRPMQRHVSSVPPRVDSPYVLKIAIDSLLENEKVYEDADNEHWRWLVWVQWHALAVCLAGLCSIRGTELSESGWSVVERSFDRHGRNIADTRSGMLWRPIEKLYRKAKIFREAGRRESQPSSTSHPATTTSQSQAQHPLRQHQKLPTPPTSTFDFSSAGAAYQPAALGHHPGPQGGLPLNPMLSGTMDFSNLDLSTGMSPGDLSWMDWENSMSDFGSMQDPPGWDTYVVGVGDGNLLPANLQQMSMNGN